MRCALTQLKWFLYSWMMLERAGRGVHLTREKSHLRTQPSQRRMKFFVYQLCFSWTLFPPVITQSWRIKRTLWFSLDSHISASLSPTCFTFDTEDKYRTIWSLLNGFGSQSEFWKHLDFSKHLFYPKFMLVMNSYFQKWFWQPSGRFFSLQPSSFLVVILDFLI